MTDSDRKIIQNSNEIHLGHLTQFGLNRIEAARIIAFTTAEIEAGIKQMSAFDNDRARNMIKACNHELEIRG